MAKNVCTIKIEMLIFFSLQKILRRIFFQVPPFFSQLNAQSDIFILYHSLKAFLIPHRILAFNARTCGV